MKRGLTSLAAVAAAALSLVACGDDDGDNDDVTIPDVEDVTTPDLPDVSLPDTIPGGITVPDISLPAISMPDLSVGERVEDLIREAFPDLDDEQVTCLLDVTGGQAPSTELIQEISETCDISLQDLIPG